MAAVLDFEKPIMEIQEKIEELKKISLESGMDLNKEIETFEQQAEDYKKELYSNLRPAQKLQIARHSERPNFLDYVNRICEDFVEFHGDREGMDDRAVIGGIAKINGRPIMIIGTMKGKSTKENLEYNFGMPQPQGYRKALRLFKHANKFGLPIITLIDTPGLVDRGSIVNYVDFDMIKKISAKKEINTDTFQLREGQCLIIPDIFRLDYINGDKNSFTFFVSNDLEIEKKDMNKIDTLKDYSKRTIEVGYHQDLVINGLGFIKIVEKAVVDVYVLNNVEVFVRDSLI